MPNAPLTTGLETPYLRQLAGNRKPNEYTDAEKSLMRLYSGAGGTKESKSTGGLTEFYTPYKIVNKMWEIAHAWSKKRRQHTGTLGGCRSHYGR